MEKISQKKKYQIRQTRLYNPHSSEPFPLSRSKIEDFLACPRCFYMDRRLGAGKPETPPFTLNKAVDELLKKEFDRYRAQKEPHPIMTEFGVNAIPFQHENLQSWRENFEGIRYHHRESNFIVFGAIDDVWQDVSNSELILLDYKATASLKEASLDSEWRASWKRQIEVYQWLFRRNGFRVSKTGYFVYCNANVAEEIFGGALKFKIVLLPYEGDDSWVEGKLLEARDCLHADRIPEPDPNCDYCAYRKSSAILAQKYGKANG